MSLSEHEQQILRDIEQRLSASDPELVKEVKETTVYRYSGKKIQIAIAVFVIGAIFMVATFTTSVVLGAIGFLVMLAALLVIEAHLRKIGKASMSAAMESWNSFLQRERLRRWRP